MSMRGGVGVAGAVIILAVAGGLWFRHSSNDTAGTTPGRGGAPATDGARAEEVLPRRTNLRQPLPAGDGELPPGVMLPAKREDPRPEDLGRMEPMDFKALTADQLLALNLDPQSPPRCFEDRKNFLRVMLAEAWLTRGDAGNALIALDGAEAEPDIYQLMADDLLDEVRSTLRLGADAVKNLSRRKENDRIFELSQLQLEDEGGDSAQRVATLNYWTGQPLSSENRELGLIELGRAWNDQGQTQRALLALREAAGAADENGPNRQMAERLIQQIEAEAKDEER